MLFIVHFFLCASPASAITPVQTGVLAYSITVDRDTVYWAEPQAIRKAPKHGHRGATTVIGRRPRIGRETVLFLDDQFIYWSEDETVQRVTKTGRRQRELANLSEGGPPLAFLLDRSYLYLVQTDRLGVLRVPKEGGEPVQIVQGEPVLATLSPNQRQQSDIVSDSESVYWIFEGKIFRVPKAGGVARPFFTEYTDCHSLVGDGTHLYWISGRRTFRGAMSGGPRRAVADEPMTVRAIRGEHIYAGNAELFRIDMMAETKVLVDECSFPKLDVELYGSELYWSEEIPPYDSETRPKIVKMDLDGSEPYPYGSLRPRKGGTDIPYMTDVIRAWLTDLKSSDQSALVRAARALPLVIELELGHEPASRTLLKKRITSSADLADLAAMLVQEKHPLLEFSSRCTDWQAKKTHRVIWAHHNEHGCSYTEVTVSFRLKSGMLLPQSIAYATGYDCE